jgi:type IV pilus assembly protein PilC
MEKAMKLRAKIKGAMIYPVTIVTVAVGVTTVLLIWGHPRPSPSLFSSFGQALPAPTQFVINLSNFTIALLSVHLRLLHRRPPSGCGRSTRPRGGRLWMDKAFLQMPVFGELIRKSSIARFTRTLSTLILLRCADPRRTAHHGKTSGNKVVERAILATRLSISEGNSISEPLIQSKVFPAHGLPDDRGRRVDRRARLRCCRRSPSSTRTRSTTWSTTSPH